MRDLKAPALAALDWIDKYGDRDGDGFVEYERRTEQGLDNQSWKDSWDSQRFHDGSLARAPIAPCEVQGYVYDAKRRVADLAREVDRRRRLKPALVPQRHDLAARQLADRSRPRAVRPLAGGAAHRAANDDCRPALQLSAAGGLRGPAPLGDAVPDCVSDGRPPAGVGGGRAGAPAAGAARASAGPASAHPGDPCASGAPLLGGDDQALRHS